MPPPCGQLVVLGGLIALGDTERQLDRGPPRGGLHAGPTAHELVEAIMQALPDAGFPRVLSAMGLARRVFAARELLPPS